MPGTVSVIGPGTGLGVAHFHRYPGGYHVQATEGGHVGFAPQDEFDDRVLAMLRARYGRVVTERVNAGPGIEAIYAALGGSDSRYIGTQAELLLEYQFDRHLSFAASYSIFTAGEFIEDTGEDEPIHFVGLEAMYRF